jgi:hypothetical protein
MGKNRKAASGVQLISDLRTRKATLRQRQPIFVKKAMELSILCDCRIRLTMHCAWNNSTIVYDSHLAQSSIPPADANQPVLSNADVSENSFECASVTVAL